jgi:hypothetical protein
MDLFDVGVTCAGTEDSGTAALDAKAAGATAASVDGAVGSAARDPDVAMARRKNTVG